MAYTAYLVEQFDANCLVPVIRKILCFANILSTLCQYYDMCNYKLHKLHYVFGYKE